VIRSLEGTVLGADEEILHLDVSGFGLEIQATRGVLSAARGGADAVLALLVVTDAGLGLYGFRDETERSVFEELTRVKNVGGRLAVGILRRLDAGAVAEAILSSNVALLSSVPGVGPKRAQTICFELRPRLEKRSGALGGGLSAQGGPAVDERVLEALETLGFSRAEGTRALLRARDGAGADAVWSEEALLASALRLLNRR
jgi:Holliday junction DNA helicase RuvA